MAGPVEGKPASRCQWSAPAPKRLPGCFSLAAPRIPAMQRFEMTQRPVLSGPRQARPSQPGGAVILALQAGYARGTGPSQAQGRNAASDQNGSTDAGRSGSGDLLHRTGCTYGCRQARMKASFRRKPTKAMNKADQNEMFWSAEILEPRTQKWEPSLRGKRLIRKSLRPSGAHANDVRCFRTAQQAGIRRDWPGGRPCPQESSTRRCKDPNRSWCRQAS